ncbi:jg3014, partial [Pararge aegeria aegeria]
MVLSVCESWINAKGAKGAGCKTDIWNGFVLPQVYIER